VVQSIEQSDLKYREEKVEFSLDFMKDRIQIPCIVPLSALIQQTFEYLFNLMSVLQCKCFAGPKP